MELTLTRKILSEHSTIGELTTAEGDFICFILEDKDRFLNSTDSLDHIEFNKVYGRTAIPLGRYQIIISWSNRFQRPLPQLLNVPGFSGIRIHSGNVPGDSSGCLLPGTHYEDDKVINSRSAFLPLMHKIHYATLNEKVFITIKRYET